MLAEELDVGMDQIKVEHAPPNQPLYGIPLLGEQATGGSTSTRDHWSVLREAGAVARTMLVTAAANRWRVDAASCTVERGVVIHAASGRKLTFGTLAKAAGALPVPSKVALKDPVTFTLIGKPLRRIDSPDKVVGAAQFGIDAKVPGMKIATVKACPTRGGKLVSVDEARAHGVPGFVEVLKIGNAVAVVGDHFWAAKQGVDALSIQWAPGENAQLTTTMLTEELAERSRNGATIAGRQQGKKPDEGKTVEALYQLPLLAHAPMEPLNTTVHVTSDRCEIWVGTQVPVRCVSVAAKITGLPESKIIVHNHYIGGGFGRRLDTDSVEQAVLFAKQVKYPLKMIWTREEDIRHDLMRPMYYDRISAVLAKDGRPLWYSDHITSGTVLARWMPDGMSKEGLDDDVIECAAETPYTLPNCHVIGRVMTCRPGSTSAGGAVSARPTIFSLSKASWTNSRMRPARIRSPTGARCSRRTPARLGCSISRREKIGWGRIPCPPRVGRGVALGSPFGSHVCLIVEAEVSPQGEVRLRRAVAAVDCGIAINPSSVEAQIQGGVLFGLSAAFTAASPEEWRLRAEQFSRLPEPADERGARLEVYRVESKEAPGGLGELGTAIAAPALGNSIFAATGVRLRSLPIDRSQLVENGASLKTVVTDSGHGGHQGPPKV